MTAKITFIGGCLLLASLVAAERYTSNRGRQEGFGVHGGYGGPGGHGGGYGGHGQPHGHGGFNHGYGHGGHGGHGGHHCADCHQPPHDHHGGQHHGNDHRHPPGPPFPNGHDHRHPQEPKQPDKQEPKERPDTQEPKRPDTGIVVNFIIHEPEGIEIWIVQQSDVVFFGIELYVNNEPTKAEAVCDVCANTTAITNGKFMIENPDVIVKKGDVLHYYVLIGNGHSVVRRKLQILLVTESIISKCNCPATSDIEDIDIRFGEKEQRTGRGALEASVVKSAPELFTATTARSVDAVSPKCTVDSDSELCPRVSKDDDEIDGPQREIQILEHIVEHMKASCSAKPTNKLVLLKQAPFAASGQNDLEKFVKSYFVISLELQKLGRAIRQVVPANPSVGQGIEFEMESYVDKQRVLYYTRVRVLEQFVDPDFTESGY